MESQTIGKGKKTKKFPNNKTIELSRTEMSTPPPPLPKKEEASPPDTPFHTPTSMTLSPQKAPDSTGQVTATVTLVSGSSATTSAETVGRLDPIMIPNLSQTPIFVHTPLNYNLEDDLSTISISRQFEIYLSPTMNENSDLFSLQSSPHIIVMKKLGEIGPLESVSGGDDDNDNAIEFWLKYLEDNNAHIVRSRQVDQLEKYLGKSIPQKIRSLVYIKTLQVRYRLNKESFSSLLKRARNSATSRNQQAYFDTLQNLPFKDVLMIFNYYIGEVVSATSARLDAINDNGGAVESTGHLPPSPFIVNIGKLLRDKVGHLENEEMLFLLLKFNKLFTVNLTRGEFFYKVNRSLETSDLTSGLFVHISKQGIDLQKIIKKWVFSFSKTK